MVPAFLPSTTTTTNGKRTARYADALEAFQVISCMDTTERLTVEEDDATVPELQAVAPRMARRSVGDYACTFYPPSARSPHRDHREGCRPDSGDGNHG